MSPRSKHPARGFCREPGAFSARELSGLHPAEALQAPYDRGAGALKMRLELLHIAARVIHLQQGAVVRLRPRLARTSAVCCSTQCSARMISGRLQTLSDGRHSPVSGSTPSASSASSVLARSSSIPPLLSPPRSTAVKYPAPHKAGFPSVVLPYHIVSPINRTVQKIVRHP